MNYIAKLLLGISILLFLSCTLDQGLAPIENGISGTITFQGEWPDNTEQVLVVAATEFPPKSITQLDMSQPLPIGQETSTYTIYLSEGLYRAVGVIWKEKGYEWDISNIIGIYFTDEDSLLPAQVNVQKNRIAENINVGANLKRASSHYESSISGTLKFKGELPEGISDLYVVASLAPFDPLPTLLDLYYGSPVPIALDSINYKIAVPPNTYQFLAALAFESGKPVDETSIKGLYEAPIIVPSGTSNITNIDFDIDRGLISSETGIAGTIAFNGEWPNNTDQVLVIASKTFPPKGIEEIYLSEPLSTEVTQTDYTIFVPADVYKAVGIVWKEVGYDWSINNIIGLYFEGGSQLIPGEVTVRDNRLTRDINITAELSRARTHYESAITGTLTFTGDWPETIESVYPVASLKPLSIIQLPGLLDLYIGDAVPIPTDQNTADYRINVPPDTYEFVAIIAFESNGAIGLESIKGTYDSRITIPDNATVIENIDINVSYE